MVNVVIFHDQNWKIKGYRVECSGTYDAKVENQIRGLLLGTRLALQELKAYTCKTDNDDVYEVIVTRQNKAAVAALKPLELALRQLVVTFPKDVDVKHF